MPRILIVAALSLLVVADASAEPKKVLMLTKSSGFQHPVIARGKKGELGLAEKTVIELGKANGFDVTVTKDGGQINRDNLAKYDALFFFTQGDISKPGLDRQPPVRVEDRPLILEFVKKGGGFVGTHCGGADTYHEWEEGGSKPFLDMVGGEFMSHGPQQVARVEVVDPDFPAMKSWPKSFSLNDEWYAYKGFNNRMRVLMMLQTEGMKGSDYKRESYPITWCSEYGKGKVFYTGLGHREDVWTNPKYREMVTTAVGWVLGTVSADASPNLAKIFGDEAKALVRINPPKK